MKDTAATIHQMTRLKIMSALNALPPQASLEFSRLKKILKVTDGNLGAHLETLEKAKYIVAEKSFVDRKPQTRLKITPAGQRAFAEHIAKLREIIELRKMS